MKTTVTAILSCLTVLFVCSCSAPTANIKGDIKQGAVLVLPPKNAEQFGKVHEHAKACGAELQFYLISGLKDKGWNVTTTNNKYFTHQDVPTKEDIIEEGKRLSSDYALYVQMGEFLDAAPFTFRQDYVNLDSAKLIDVRSGSEIWKIDAGYSYGMNMEMDSGNPGSVWRFLPRMAKDIVKSINKASDKSSKSRPPKFDEKQLAKAGYKLLNGAEIRTALSGNTLFAKAGDITASLYYTEDGNIRSIYRSSSESLKKTKGKWNVTEDNMYCRKFTKTQRSCLRVYLRGIEFIIVKPNGKKMSEGLIVQGNPKGL